MSQTEMREWLADRMDGETVTWDGCEAALVGVVERCGQPSLPCYDYALLVQCFVGEGMTEDEAQEWVDFNIAGAWVGERTPVILYRPDLTS